jgi:Uma2 family endonuclease
VRRIVLHLPRSFAWLERWRCAYARAGLADYWIVNLVDWRVEVYRRPAADHSAELGWRHLDVGLFGAGTTIAPLARPDVSIALSDILPEALRRRR